MRIDVVSIFPAMFDALSEWGITSRALQRGLWQLHRWNPRDFARDAYRSIDDRPYGGGQGMVMLPDVLADTLAAVAAAGTGPRAPVIHLSPRGRPLDHAGVKALAALPALTLLASRYEAVDQRLLDHHVDDEISVGDFVVSGGELPAMMLIDAMVRLLPGALNDIRSALEESFSTGLLEGPQYTRPEVFEGAAVPPVLLSGHHARITRWRRDQALRVTRDRRPELVARAREQGLLDKTDLKLLESLLNETKPDKSG